MADRFFPNEMLYVVEECVDKGEAVAATGRNFLNDLLQIPYRGAAEQLFDYGLKLKEEVVRKTWYDQQDLQDGLQDYNLYTGALGTAYLLLKCYQITDNRSDLKLCSDIASVCDVSSVRRKGSPALSSHSSFMCGRAGVCAIGAVAANYLGDEEQMNYYIRSLLDMKFPIDVSNELLGGLAGYLWSCLFVRKHLGDDKVTDHYTVGIANRIIRAGRGNPVRGQIPLLYRNVSWGASSGLAGILHVLMDIKLEAEQQQYVKDTLKYMINNRLPSGNYPIAEKIEDDILVDWCNGAPGIALTLTKAYQVFEEVEFLDAAVEAAEVVWKRGLLKRVGLCNGISGNAYVFLALYRATNNLQYLYKAKTFASFLREKLPTPAGNGEIHCGDHPYSLFEGIGGMSYLFLDMMKPLESRFPGYEL